MSKLQIMMFFYVDYMFANITLFGCIGRHGISEPIVMELSVVTTAALSTYSAPVEGVGSFVTFLNSDS